MPIALRRLRLAGWAVHVSGREGKPIAGGTPSRGWRASLRAPAAALTEAGNASVQLFKKYSPSWSKPGGRRGRAATEALPPRAWWPRAQSLPQGRHVEEPAFRSTPDPAQPTPQAAAHQPLEGTRTPSGLGEGRGSRRAGLGGRPAHQAPPPQRRLPPQPRPPAGLASPGLLSSHPQVLPLRRPVPLQWPLPARSHSHNTRHQVPLGFLPYPVRALRTPRGSRACGPPTHWLGSNPCLLAL